MNAKAMTVAGVMSGTSADGIDVGVVRIAPGKLRPRLTLLAHEGFAYPAALRRKVLAAMNAESTSTAELARLNWRLGMAYAEALTATVKRHKVKLDLIGCHGQTLYHQARTGAYAGRSFACTWQLGEAALIAGALGIPVVSNFRPADMVAGGQGAAGSAAGLCAVCRWRSAGGCCRILAGLRTLRRFLRGLGRSAWWPSIQGRATW